MAKKKVKSNALAIRVNPEAIIQRSREVGALAKPENLDDLKRYREAYRAAAGYAKTLKDGRVKLLGAATLQLRAEIQIGAVLQELNKGNDITDTRYEEFLREQTITSSQANRWRDMGYSMAKKMKAKSIVDASLKFTPEFFAKFEEYVAWCAEDPTGEAVPGFNGFSMFLHQTHAQKEKERRLQVFTVFCRNIPFLEAENIYQKLRLSEHLDVPLEDFDKLVWQVVLDKGNLFFGQSAEMTRRAKAKTNAI